ncbi:MAG: response regulator [Gammaproteobacteria bacterium]|nr:response regulator [Gammaproteobacteria bacterium]
MASKKSYLTPNKVAELLMVSPSAIRLWSEKGDLKAMVTAGGHRRFKLEDIKQFACDKKIQLNIVNDNKPKVLIVDDESLFAQFLKTALLVNDEELEVAISLDGFDAGIMVKEFQPTVVLLDIMMEGIDGFQVCKKIKQDPLLQHIRVIVLSGNITLSQKQRLMDLGAETCFDKPVDMSELIRRLYVQY